VEEEVKRIGTGHRSESRSRATTGRPAGATYDPRMGNHHEAISWNAPDSDHPGRIAAKRSLAAVADHDVDAWLAVYAPDAVVQDPVGPSMFDPEGQGHHGHDGLRAFWDTVIATVDTYRFTIHDSFANGSTCANVATFTTTVAEGTDVDTDLVTVYTVDDDGLITSMKAYWEPERAMATARKD
jgi:ketosteroid isomerase-like protein